METELPALMVRFPPRPPAVPELLLTICAPLVRVSVPTLTLMLPAFPWLIVLAWIRPRSIIRVPFGTETVRSPTLLWNFFLRQKPAYEMVIESVAETTMLPARALLVPF